MGGVSLPRGSFVVSLRPRKVWVRWIVVVLLNVALLPLLLCVLALLRLNGTFLKPEFYVDQIERADVYRFLMVDVLSSIVDEWNEIWHEMFPGTFEEDALASYGLTTAQVVGAVNRALPPEKLEEMVAPSVLQVAEFVVGERDDVELIIPIGDHAPAIIEEMERLFAETGVYAMLVERELTPRVREAAIQALTSNPDASGWMSYLFDTPEDAADRIAQASSRVASPGWVQEQTESAFDEVVPYLVGDADGFSIRVLPDGEQVDAAVNEVSSILREADAYDLLYTEVVEPAGPGSRETVIRLPHGVEITWGEVVDILRQVAPPSWVQEQTERLIADVGPYLAGRSDEFLSTISLVDNKREAEGVLAELVGAKITEAVLDLPACGARGNTPANEMGLGRGVPSCIPAGVSAGNIVERLWPEAAESIRPLLLDPIPDKMTFTELDLRTGAVQVGGREALDLLDDARVLLIEGWTYGSADLRADLGESVDVLHGTRALLSEGYIYTHRYGSGAESGDSIGELMDAGHGQSTAIRQYGWIAYVGIGLSIAAIFLLGGRTWQGKLMWVSLSVLVASAAALMVSWPLYEAFFEFDARDDIAAQLGPDSDFQGTYLLIADKITAVVEQSVDEFVGWIRWWSGVLVAVASAVFLGALLWRRFRGRQTPTMVVECEDSAPEGGERETPGYSGRGRS